MQVNISAKLRVMLDTWAAVTGRSADELVEDALVGYFDELADIRAMLDRRYDDLQSGREKSIDGELFFERLRKREEILFGR